MKFSPKGNSVHIDSGYWTSKHWELWYPKWTFLQHSDVFTCTPRTPLSADLIPKPLQNLPVYFSLKSGFWDKGYSNVKNVKILYVSSKILNFNTAWEVFAPEENFFWNFLVGWRKCIHIPLRQKNHVFTTCTNECFGITFCVLIFPCKGVTNYFLNCVQV